jgi:hypothetical protein
MIDVTIERGLDVLRKFRRLPAGIQKGVVRGLTGALLETEGHVRTRADIKSRRGAAGLFGRLTSYVKAPALLDVDAAIGFRRAKGFPYELSHEYGAKAKPGGAMAMPLTPEAKQYESPRSFPRRLFVWKSATGSAFLAEKRPRSIKVQYLLLKSLPARLHFRQTVQDSMWMIMDRVVKESEKETGRV